MFANIYTYIVTCHVTVQSITAHTSKVLCHLVIERSDITFNAITYRSKIHEADLKSSFFGLFIDGGNKSSSYRS